MFPNSRLRNARRIILLFILISIFMLPLPGAAKSEKPTLADVDALAPYAPLPTFDIRQTRRSRTQSGNVEQKKSRLSANAAALDNIVLRWDEQMDLPRHLLSLDAPLTAPSADDAEVIAKRFARNNRALFGVADRQLDAARVSARSTDERGGFTRLALEQRVGGIRVFGSEMVFVIDREGRVLAESGCFIPGVEDRARRLAAALSPVEALHRAAVACGAQLDAPVAATLEKTPARERNVFSSPELDSRSEASLVYYSVTRDEVRLAWQVLLYGAPTRIDSYLVLVDARSGEILLRDSLVYAMEPPRGRVFTKENPVVSGDRELVVLSGDPTASPNGWVTDNRTEGNNTRVTFNPDLSGGNTIKANDDGHFDFSLDLAPASSPLDSSKASAANLFYWVNVVHDRFHALGFNETSRNFQMDNFGRGGLGYDPVRAETLRGAGIDQSSTTQLVRNNAFFSAALEGSSPLVAMLMWTPTINGQPRLLDSSYDAGVIIHEYTHGVSIRLTGTDNEFGVRNTQGRGMGEGWSDFFAVSFLDDGSRPLDSSVMAGNYLVNQPTRGIRSHPYTTRYEVNPLTFGDIQYNSAVHAQGTVWCNMLWGVRQELIARYGFEAGRRAAEKLVIDGLKMTPVSPLFTEARDAILLADRATNGGANQDIIWRAFARRGLGAAATTSFFPDPFGYRIKATESYIVPPDISAGSLVIDEKLPAPAVLGEALPLAVVDGDLMAAESVEARATNLRTGQSITLTLARSVPGRFTGSLQLPLPGVDGGPGARLDAAPGDAIAIAYENARNAAGSAETLELRATAGRRVTVYAEDFESGAPGWLYGVNQDGSRNYWHVTQRRAATLVSSFLFAKEKPNKVFTPQGSRGAALSPTIDLQGLVKPSLEFYYFFSGLSSFPPDSMALVPQNVRASSQEPSLPVIFDLFPVNGTTFSQGAINLRFIENRRAALLLSFLASSLDVKRKKLEGFYLDSLRVTAVSTQP